MVIPFNNETGIYDKKDRVVESKMLYLVTKRLGNVQTAPCPALSLNRHGEVLFSAAAYWRLTDSQSVGVGQADKTDRSVQWTHAYVVAIAT